MKKKIIISIIAAAALCAAILYEVLPAGADTPGPLDHVTVTPPSATVSANGTVQFVASGYDSANIGPLTGVTFAWTVSPATGAGTVDPSGLYTAPATAVTATLTVTATQGSITKTASATVTVTTASTPVPTTPTLNVGKLSGMLNSYLNSVGFANFLGGQWQVKDGTATDTIQVTAGVVQTVTTTGLTVLANGQTAPTSYTLSSATKIMPSGVQLTANDNVVVVLVNSQLTEVIKITPPAAKTGNQSGSKEKDNENENGNGHSGVTHNSTTPPGWSHGNKTGWANGHSQHSGKND